MSLFVEIMVVGIDRVLACLKEYLDIIPIEDLDACLLDYWQV